MGADDEDWDIGWEAEKEGSAYHGRVAAHALPSFDYVIDFEINVPILNIFAAVASQSRNRN